MIVGWVAGIALADGNLAVNRLFTDHTVLQRDMPVPVWGTAKPGTMITVTFGQQEKTAETGKDGKWLVRLDALKTSAEPDQLTVKSLTGDKPVTISDVLVGDVWFCSGQSNMEWVMKQFDSVGKGLIIGKKNGEEQMQEVPSEKLGCFALAIADPSSPKGLKWSWADAVIDGDTVVVSSPDIQNPVAARYACICNPKGNKLYNKEGLPASPFRTDDGEK